PHRRGPRRLRGAARAVAGARPRSRAQSRRADRSIPMPQHPALVPGRVAVVTGGASGIGLAAARRFAGMGLKVVVGDRPGEALEAVRAELGGQGEAVAIDVSRAEDLVRLREAAQALGDVAVVMN